MKEQPKKSPDSHLPVIVGIGEISDHPPDPTAGLEPLALMVEALKRAEQDAGKPLLARIDSLDEVCLVSWRYRDPVGELSKRLGIKPAHAAYGPVGGETPLRLLNDAAQRIAAGESQIAAICGAEAQSTVNKSMKAGIKLPWTPYAFDAPDPRRNSVYQRPVALALGVALPTTVYPFYENAFVAHWDQTPREARRESGILWSTYSKVASTNPNAWLKHYFQPDEIINPTTDNRMISWPYTKLMVANPTVNQGAAVLMTSLARARTAGIPEDRLVYLHGGAWAEEPFDYLERDVYFESQAQNAVLDSVRGFVDGHLSLFEAIELYSCFPCVPKMARRTLGLDDHVQPTVTGGLTFFGAPLNNYMTHATCAMVRCLRAKIKLGLLYGQGGYVTKHHALVLASQPPPGGLMQNRDVQTDTNRRRRPVPDFLMEAIGPASVETFTVVYDLKGEIDHGVVILRLPEGARTIARVPRQDQGTIRRLIDLDRTPIGTSGRISRADDGILEWKI
ncbi:MAG: acetyl-CoA acetyltransferase [Thermodesulfobacteriota bacterium]|jgi:acetyl-CoA C-acetyltransferase